MTARTWNSAEFVASRTVRMCGRFCAGLNLRWRQVENAHSDLTHLLDVDASGIFGLENSRGQATVVKWCSSTVKSSHVRTAMRWAPEVDADIVPEGRTESDDPVIINPSGDTGSHARDEEQSSGLQNLTHWKRRSTTIHLDGRWWAVGGGCSSTRGSMWGVQQT